MSALIILSEGAEELETVTVADVLARAGIKVTLGGLQGSGVVKCSRGVGIQADVALESVTSKLYDVVVMPGGLNGAKSMASSDLVGKLLRAHYNAGKYVAAICAAPMGLQSHKIALGKKLTCYPSCKDTVPDFNYCEDSVVVDGKLVTSRGPGTAMPFALKLVELLVDKNTAHKIASGMLVEYS
ncbi:hypothetical protein CRM22_006535 [Opisthorchis felineus]|uniref:DJ-1/PfpI domain-containing protein n=1 Tax=Opisthorchis felineus TaxID=147828 RepID=A0A4S2LRY2_OPIFE|nr:hypothetical protein CRM22_006535 [Opisthorchis felineus]